MTSKHAVYGLGLSGAEYLGRLEVAIAFGERKAPLKEQEVRPRCHEGIFRRVSLWKT